MGPALAAGTTVCSVLICSLSSEADPFTVVVVVRPFTLMDGGNRSVLPRIIFRVGTAFASLLVENPTIVVLENARAVDIDIVLIILLVVNTAIIIIISCIIPGKDVFLLAAFCSLAVLLFAFGNTWRSLCGIVCGDDSCGNDNDAKLHIGTASNFVCHGMHM